MIMSLSTNHNEMKNHADWFGWETIDYYNLRWLLKSLLSLENTNYLDNPRFILYGSG